MFQMYIFCIPCTMFIWNLCLSQFTFVEKYFLIYLNQLNKLNFFFGPLSYEEVI